MSEQFTCDDVRDRAFEYRRGELDAGDRESVEAHLEGCAACRDYVEKLFTLMSSTPEIEEPSDAYADALFGNIAAQIERDARPEEHADAAEDEFAPAAPGFRWGTAAIGLAAGFVLAIGIGWFLSANGIFAGSEVGQGTEVVEQSEVPDESAGAASQTVDERQFSTLRFEPSRRAGVGILASENAQWTIRGQSDLVLELERGTVLVEYLPREGRQFRVEARGMKVRVVGTIFYVSANGESTAGVVTGAVEVKPDGGDAVKVEQGQRVRAGGEVEGMPPESVEMLRSQVDVRRHHAALRQRMTSREETRRGDGASSQPSRTQVEVAKRAEAQSEPPPEPQLADPLARRRANAEAAIRDGHYGRAETIYKKLLEELDASHPAAPSIHLDLAGLYLEQMDQPSRALPYLREFLRKWPNDVASSAVRRRLCTVADELGVDEPRCDAGTRDR